VNREISEGCLSITDTSFGVQLTSANTTNHVLDKYHVRDKLK
jgi:hypothetical protein